MPNQATYASPRLDLGMALAEYDYAQAGYIGLQALPIMPVPRQAATFSKVTREGLLRREDVKRSKRGAYNRGTYETEDDTYACEEYGHEQPLDDSERAFYANDFDAEFWAAQVAYHRVIREHEIRTAALLFNATTWTGASLTTAVGTEWSTVSSDILGDVTAAKEKVRVLTGMQPNGLIVSQKVYNNMRRNTALIDAVKYTHLASDEIVRTAIADYLGVDSVLVGKAVYNSVSEGGTYTGADVWSAEYAMVAILGRPGAQLVTPCVGRTMVWEQDTPATAGIVTEEYREEATRSWIYRVRQNVDEKVFDPSFAHLLSNITA